MSRGLQEALKGQIDDLQALLPDYAWLGVGREDGMEQGEFAPIFYRRDRLDTLRWGTFWLSETPDIPGSRSWDAALERIATWTVLRDRQTSEEFLAVNTHFDHRGAEAPDPQRGTDCRKPQRIGNQTVRGTG